MTDLRSDFSKAEVEKFQQFFDLAEADDSTLEPEDVHDLYDQYFRTPDELKAYDRWLVATNRQEPQKPNKPVTLTLPDPHPLHIYRDQLANMNFSNVSNVAGVSQLLNCGFHPHIPLGYTDDTRDTPEEFQHNAVFRLVPNTNLLSPTKEMNWKHGTSNHILSSSVLGINHGVRLNTPLLFDDEQRIAINRYLDDSDEHSSDEDDYEYDLDSFEDYFKLEKKVAKFSTPFQRYGKYGQTVSVPSAAGDASNINLQADQWDERVLPSTEVHASSKTRKRTFHLSEESTRSGDSTTMNDATGFAFYQLGALYYCSPMDDPTTTERQVISEQTWYRTEYIVAAKINATGRLGSIWLIWDFWAGDGEGEPEWVQPHLNFPGTSLYFTAAKIADNFAALQADRKLNISEAPGEFFDEDFELVGCFRTPEGKIVRQWVVDPTE